MDGAAAVDGAAAAAMPAAAAATPAAAAPVAAAGVPVAAVGHQLTEDEKDQLLLIANVSRGSYGCVFSGESASAPVAVKLYYGPGAKAAEWEVAAMQHLHKQDKRTYEHYVVVPHEWLLVTHTPPAHGPSDTLASLRAVVGGAVMHLQAGSLYGLIYQRAVDVLPLALRVHYLHDIAMGLCHIHGAGMAHRDIKSDNILIGFDGKAKITDFGSAAFVCSHNPDLAPEQTTGSLLFMPPEVLAAQYPHHLREHGATHADDGGGTAAPAAVAAAAAPTASGTAPTIADHQTHDVFAFGVVLSEVLTGRVPYREWFADVSDPGQERAYVRAVCGVEGDGPLPLRPLRPDALLHLLDSDAGFKASLNGIMADCWNADPAQRPTAQQLRSRLKALADGLPLAASARFSWADTAQAVTKSGSNPLPSAGAKVGRSLNFTVNWWLSGISLDPREHAHRMRAAEEAADKRAAAAKPPAATTPAPAAAATTATPRRPRRAFDWEGSSCSSSHITKPSDPGTDSGDVGVDTDATADEAFAYPLAGTGSSMLTAGAGGRDVGGMSISSLPVPGRQTSTGSTGSTGSTVGFGGPPAHVVAALQHGPTAPQLQPTARMAAVAFRTSRRVLANTARSPQLLVRCESAFSCTRIAEDGDTAAAPATAAAAAGAASVTSPPTGPLSSPAGVPRSEAVDASAAGIVAAMPTAQPGSTATASAVPAASTAAAPSRAVNSVISGSASLLPPATPTTSSAAAADVPAGASGAVSTAVAPLPIGAASGAPVVPSFTSPVPGCPAVLATSVIATVEGSVANSGAQPAAATPAALPVRALTAAPPVAAAPATAAQAAVPAAATGAGAAVPKAAATTTVTTTAAAAGQQPSPLCTVAAAAAVPSSSRQMPVTATSTTTPQAAASSSSSPAPTTSTTTSTTTTSTTVASGTVPAGTPCASVASSTAAPGADAGPAAQTRGAAAPPASFALQKPAATAAGSAPGSGAASASRVSSLPPAAGAPASLPAASRSCGRVVIGLRLGVGPSPPASTTTLGCAASGGAGTSEPAASAGVATSRCLGTGLTHIKEHGVVTLEYAPGPALTPEEWQRLPIPDRAAPDATASALVRVATALPAGVRKILRRNEAASLLAVTDAQLDALEAAVGVPRGTTAVNMNKLWPALAAAARPVAGFAAATYTAVEEARALLASEGGIVFFRLDAVECVLAATADACQAQYVSVRELCATAARLPLQHLQYAVARAMGWSVAAASPSAVSVGDGAAPAALPTWMPRHDAADRVRGWLRSLRDVLLDHHVDASAGEGADAAAGGGGGGGGAAAARRTLALCAQALAPPVGRVLGTGAEESPLQLCQADEAAAGREWTALRLVPYDFALWLAHHGLPPAHAEHWRQALGPDVVAQSPHIDSLQFIPADAVAFAERRLRSVLDAPGGGGGGRATA